MHFKPKVGNANIQVRTLVAKSDEAIFNPSFGKNLLLKVIPPPSVQALPGPYLVTEKTLADTGNTINTDKAFRTPKTRQATRKRGLLSTPQEPAALLSFSSEGVANPKTMTKTGYKGDRYYFEMENKRRPDDADWVDIFEVVTRYVIRELGSPTEVKGYNGTAAHLLRTLLLREFHDDLGKLKFLVRTGAFYDTLDRKRVDTVNLSLLENDISTKSHGYLLERARVYWPSCQFGGSWSDNLTPAYLERRDGFKRIILFLIIGAQYKRLWSKTGERLYCPVTERRRGQRPQFKYTE
jgi:hypothetical protein